MNTQTLVIEAESVDIPAPTLLNKSGIEEICGVLEVSIGAMHVVQHVMAKEEKTHTNLITNWQKNLGTIRAEFSGFISEFHKKLEESQRIAFQKEQMSLEQYNELLSTTLADSMEKILFVSKRAVMLVYTLDEMMTALSSIGQYITDIKSINKQANMLAVNASIEAVRAGQAGQNFAVVAVEIKDIAESIKTLSSDMHSRVKYLTTMVESGYGVLQEIATVDLDSSIQNKDKMDAMLEALKNQQKHSSILLKGEAQEHEALLAILDKIISDMRGFQPFTPPLCGGLEQIATRQQQLKKSLETTTQDSRTLPNMQLAESIAESFAQEDLNELLHDALSGKEVRLSLAMQQVRRIPTDLKEEK
jgi:hypothetical protein